MSTNKNIRTLFTAVVVECCQAAVFMFGTVNYFKHGFPGVLNAELNLSFARLSLDHFAGS